MSMPTSVQSIREIVSTQPSAAAVLQRFGIDLCSYAETSVTHACDELQLSVEQVLEKLSDALTAEHGAEPADLASYSLKRLIQHIVRAHHSYIRRELPRIAQMSRAAAAKHGVRSPELKRVEVLVERLHAAMLTHLDQEEQSLFPYIAQMEEGPLKSIPPGNSHFDALPQSVSMMIEQHEPVEEILPEMRSITNDFQPPAWACPTYIALYGGLEALEKDLRQHMHLENDLLFPRALEMERKHGQEK